jgi:DNA polymerase-3 subunit chi
VTDVEFHTGVADRLGYSCRLLRKACRQGARVMVTAQPDVLAELDVALWTFDAGEFLPHVRVPAAPAGHSPGLLLRTPVWLGTTVWPHPAAPRLLLNLGADAPVQRQTLDRLIEVVSTDEDDISRGRARWRAYKAEGLNIQHHPGAEGRG